MRGQKVKVDAVAGGGVATEGGSTTGTEIAAEGREEGEGEGEGGGELAQKRKEGTYDSLMTKLPCSTIV